MGMNIAGILLQIHAVMHHVEKSHKKKYKYKLGYL